MVVRAVRFAQRLAHTEPLASMLDPRPELTGMATNIFWIGDVDPDTVRGTYCSSKVVLTLILGVPFVSFLGAGSANATQHVSAFFGPICIQAFDLSENLQLETRNDWAERVASRVRVLCGPHRIRASTVARSRSVEYTGIKGRYLWR